MTREIFNSKNKIFLPSLKKKHVQTAVTIRQWRSNESTRRIKPISRITFGSTDRNFFLSRLAQDVRERDRVFRRKSFEMESEISPSPGGFRPSARIIRDSPDSKASRPRSGRQTWLRKKKKKRRNLFRYRRDTSSRSAGLRTVVRHCDTTINRKIHTGDVFNARRRCIRAERLVARTNGTACRIDRQTLRRLLMWPRWYAFYFRTVHHHYGRRAD